METLERKQSMNVLLVGNNPIELSGILGKLMESNASEVIAEIAFDFKGLLQRLMNFTPNYIVIDDNIGREELGLALAELSHNKKTKDIPITVLKNSNYSESDTTGGVLDYLLKQSLTPESFVVSLKNSLKFRRTQLYLYKAYKDRKQHLQTLLR